MLLRTLITNAVDGTKFVVYTSDGHLVWAGTKEQTYGTLLVSYGRGKVKHYGVCHNKSDGSYVSVTLK